MRSETTQRAPGRQEPATRSTEWARRARRGPCRRSPRSGAPSSSGSAAVSRSSVGSSAAAERAGRDAMLVVAGEPQPVVVTGSQTRRPSRRSRCRPAWPRSVALAVAPPTPGSTTRVPGAGPPLADARARPRSPPRRPPTNAPTPGQRPGASGARVARRARGRRARARGRRARRTARPARSMTFSTGTVVERPRDRGEVAQLGAARRRTRRGARAGRSPRPDRSGRAPRRRARRASRGTDQSSRVQPNSSSARRIAFSA